MPSKKTTPGKHDPRSKEPSEYVRLELEILEAMIKDRKSNRNPDRDQPDSDRKSD